jgi:hypothetical protein
MSVELHAEEGTNVLDITLSGKLVREDYEHFVPEVERLIQERGKLRILCRLKDFHGWTLSAMWEDIKFDWRHFSDIERVAFIGDKRWEAGMAVFCKPFTRATVRYFDAAEAVKAAEWIHEGVAETSAGAR